MTPEEKAKQLIEKFSPHTDCAGDQATMSEAKAIQLIHAKKCAIYCVEQLGENKATCPFPYEIDMVYWGHVKKHIENYKL